MLQHFNAGWPIFQERQFQARPPNSDMDQLGSQAPASLADVLSPVTLPCSGRTITNKLVKVAEAYHARPTALIDFLGCSV